MYISFYNSTKEGGDYLTLIDHDNGQARIAQDEEYLHDVQLSPLNHNKHIPDHEMLCSQDEGGFPSNATFLRLADGSGNKQLLGSDQDLAYLRDVAGQLFDKWKGETSPALARRLRDFQFAQDKRRAKFGHERPWGILGLYDHLAAVRADITWAEDAACRRANGEP
jgi:hypothetical protein